LNSSPKGGDFQLEEFYQPQPGFERAIKLINPSAGKIMKRVFTVFAAVSFSYDSVSTFAVASGAKNTPIFPAVFSEIEPSRILGFNNVFKGFKVHRHHYNFRYLVSKLL
jgi:hypothetical protein